MSMQTETRRVRDAVTLVAVLAGYWVAVFPRARRELAHWRAAAAAIPDARLRAVALRTLEQEHGLAEGAAIFAVLVPRRAVRHQLVRLLVAWQVAYDYLDTVGELPASERACDGAELYATLAAVLDPRADVRAPIGDGGYLDALLACCRASTAALPSFAAVGPLAVRAAERCAQGQVHTHTTATEGPAALRAWALAQPQADGHLWWEVAAGAISSLAVHALLASAALPGVTAAEAARVDAAYFPSICAVSTLLDSMVDTDDDVGTDNHRCTVYYDGPAEAWTRLETLVRDAAGMARTLPRGRAHAVILAGMTAYYAAAGWDDCAHLHRRVAAAAGGGGAAIRWTLRLRARLGELRARCARSG